MTDEPREPDGVLDPLVRAFRELPAPSPARELDAEDEATRRAVAWTAAAWHAQAPASNAPPAELLARAARRAPRRERIAWRPLAAAAAVLLLLGGALLFADRVLRGPAATPIGSTAAATPPDAPVAQAPQADVTPPDIVTPPAAPASGVVAVADDHLELRSGPVRMLLFLNAPPSTREDLR